MSQLCTAGMSSSLGDVEQDGMKALHLQPHWREQWSWCSWRHIEGFYGGVLGLVGRYIV